MYSIVNHTNKKKQKKQSKTKIQGYEQNNSTLTRNEIENRNIKDRKNEIKNDNNDIANENINYSYTYNYDSTKTINGNVINKKYLPCCMVSLFCGIMNPMGTFRNFWNFIITFLLLYTCIEIPYTIAFEVNLTLDDWSGILAFSIDICLLVDIIINFRTAYFDSYDSLVLITDPKKIAKKLFFFLSFCLSVFLYFMFSVLFFLAFGETFVFVAWCFFVFLFLVFGFWFYCFFH